ncbi:MAG: 3'-5' exonuclease [Pseudomonadota bacterium]
MILTEFEGRQNLLGRIGPEAEDGIDELLNQALLFEATNIPSLTAFLDYANASDVEIKRQSDASGRLIRVMTVHGAKGLESPIVILPDTTAAPPRANQEIVRIENGLPMLTVSDKASPDALIEAKNKRKAAVEAERDRLLYVAMTRAEKWLIVCGVKPKGNGERLNWHSRIQGGLNGVGAQLLDNGNLRYAVGNWPETAETPCLVTDQDEERLPTFGSPRALSLDRPVSPSDLGGDKSLPTSDGAGGGVVKGQYMHHLLEHLPTSKEPLALGRQILGAQRPPVHPKLADQLCVEALQIIDEHPTLFDANTLAEVEVTGFSLTLEAHLSGAIDRLIISQDVVTAVDFKTNSVVPTTENDVPEGILRQMGAYLEVLEQIYADRQIVVAILWTETGNLMPLKHAIVRAALQRATTS